MRWSWGFLAAAVACKGGKDDSGGGVGPPDDTAIEGDDKDHDGFSPDQGDCDDGDPDRYPGRAEDCNAIDDNCNNTVDEGFGDADSDGTKDCFDSEECDGKDNNGDGKIDEGFGDSDDDGLADCLDSEGCDGKDNDGDGQIDEDFDADHDLFTTCGDPVDCDDEAADRNPGEAEIVDDGIDNDCDGVIDEGVWTHGAGTLVITEIMNNPSVADPMGEWFELYNPGTEALSLNGVELRSGAELHTINAEGGLFVEPGGYVVLGLNGDPSSNGGVLVDYVYDGLTLGNESDSLSVWGGKTEIDSVTWDDGDTMPDPDGASMAVDPWFLDSVGNDEGSHWCDAGLTTSPPSTAGAENVPCPTYDHDGDGYSGEEGDCDDTDITFSPGVDEIWYDGIDQNCDELSDFDQDYDGFDASGYGGDDCNDVNDAVHLGAKEVCDLVDNDCDGNTDGSEAIDRQTFYQDLDEDGYGNPAVSEQTCEAPSGYVLDDSDCDDTHDEVNPDGTEVCGDGLDNDCDAFTDICDVDIYEIGAVGSKGTWGLSSYWVGNTYEATEDRTIHSFAVEVDANVRCAGFELLVFQKNSPSDYDLLYKQTISGVDGTDWYQTDEFDLDITAGTTYVAGVASTCSGRNYPYAHYTYRSPRHADFGKDGGFGTFVGFNYAYDYDGSDAWTPDSSYSEIYYAVHLVTFVQME